MSASSAIPVAPALDALWKQAQSINTIRAIIVKIDNESFVPVADTRSSVSVKRDFEALTGLAQPPCYILFRLSGKDSWLLVSYVPDTASVNDRMLYASSKATLSRLLGSHYFTNEMQVSSAADLDFSNYEASVVPSTSPKPYSAHEIAHQEILREEERERDFRAGLRTQPGSPGPKKGSGIGGYHTVTIPLSPAAKAALSSSSFVELAITEDATLVNVVSQSHVSDLAGAKAHIHPSEPRFYLLKTAGKNVFIYHCPDASPAKYRMVYSTAKPSIKSQIEATPGLSNLKTLEIRGVEDLTSDALTVSHSASYGYTRPSTPIPGSHFGGGSAGLRQTSSASSQVPHPVYNMISQAQGGSPRAGTKKIVIPPPGAY